MNSDPYKYFRIESRQLLDKLSSGILALESGAPTATSTQELFRAAHTLKGAARIVGHRAIADASHALEDDLSVLRASGASPDSAAIERMLTHLKDIQQQLEALNAPNEAPTTSADAPSPPNPTPGPELVLIRGDHHADLLSSLREAHAALTHVASVVSSEAFRAAVSRANAGGDIEQLDYWLELGLREIAASHVSANRLYYVPIDELLPAIELTARDVATVQGKSVSVRMSGRPLRLASDFLSKLKPALVQLTRNAVAHGIEPAEERRRAGKSASGSIEIRFRRAGRRLIVSCEDDGRGVNLQALRRAASDRGVQAPGPSDEDVLSLLTRTPLSTAGRIDQTAGRGVGLELVGSVAQELGGSVRLVNRPGQGVRFELDVPASAGELEALLVESAGQRYLVPLEQVARGLVSGAKSTRQEGGSVRVEVDGGLLRVVDLAAEFAATDSPLTLVILKSSGGRVALRVDAIVDIRTVTLTSVKQLHLVDPSISGVTLFEDGSVVPVLDAEHLSTRPGVALGQVGRERARILVVDDSLTSRSLEQSILEAAGYLVDTASSAEEGLRKTDQRRYSLCLVDVEMPGMDGFSFIRALRSKGETQAIPAILISSRNSASDREAGRNAGAQDYMAKQDFDQARLLRRIQELTR